jgi:lipopolysaccharide transport system ATP-binding protein
MCCDNIIEISNLTKWYAVYKYPYHRLFQTLGMGHLKLYKEFYALRDVSIHIKKGECIGIIGRNGAGKSTLLQVIAETLQPNSGSVKINGRIAALLELGSGFNPEFTGVENIYMYGAILGLSRRQIDERFQKIIDFADIGDAIMQPVKTYSSGMAMRLAFAVAAHIDADILVVDEALAVGDIIFTQKCFAFLREFIKTHTVILVTHDIATVRDLCSRVIWLRDGKVEQDGQPEAVTDNYLKYCYEIQQGKSVTPSNDTPQQTVSNRKDVRKNIWEENPQSVPQYTFFEFDEQAPSFGKGGAKITDVCFCNENGEPVFNIAGGEKVRLQLTISAIEEIHRPIVGFSFRNQRGEPLFGDNTFEMYKDQPVHLNPGDTLRVIFEFEMPRLESGGYSLHAAIADGTQDTHVQHQWFHNCLTITSTFHSKIGVMVGIPMHRIEMTCLPETEQQNR